MNKPTEGKAKGCHNCVHRYGWFRTFWQCSRTGFYTETQRKYPNSQCDAELSGWAKR